MMREIKSHSKGSHLPEHENKYSFWKLLPIVASSGLIWEQNNSIDCDAVVRGPDERSIS